MEAVGMLALLTREYRFSFVLRPCSSHGMCYFIVRVEDSLGTVVSDVKELNALHSSSAKWITMTRPLVEAFNQTVSRVTTFHDQFSFQFTVDIGVSVDLGSAYNGLYLNLFILC